MKALRLLLVFILALTLFSSSTAQAKDGERYGFMPLVKQVDASIPLRIQSQKALNRLMPELLAAQNQGTILDFEPELSTGILKIKYAAGTNKSTLGTAQVFDNIHTAVAMVPHTEPVRTQTVSGLSPSFLISLYSSCFMITNLNSNSYVFASLRNKKGAIMATYAGNASSSGSLNDCFDYTGVYSDILPGYKLTYVVYDTFGGAVLGNYTTVAPPINVTAINKKTSVLTSTSSPGKAYSIWWYQDNLDAGNSFLAVNKTGIIRPTGQWSVDFGTVKFRGGDEFDIDVTQNANFTFTRTYNVPSIYCQLASNYCALHGSPLMPATLSIVHGGKTYTFNGTFSACGCFGVNLLSAAGTPISLAFGDKISGTGVAVYALPRLKAVANLATDVVTGIAPANRYFEVAVKDSYTYAWYTTWVHANSAGNYSSSFASQFDMMPGYPFVVDVYYTDILTGNVTERYMPVGP
jgi:hypothetical protein